MSQQWTCVDVPWTVDYLDTKFQFTIAESGPVVIVLSQPDDRYFYGLRGRFLYSLHFRVFKEGEEGRWIVRSMHNSGNETVFTRSVSAEIEDLEPGTYNVVFKVTATRTTVSSTAEESIMKYAVERKEKLLHVGRRYDYAHTKGNLRTMEQDRKSKKKLRRKTKHYDGFKKTRKLNQQEKERARRRKQRIADAMKEKRKAYETARREKARQRKQRMMERREDESVDAQAGAGSENSETKADNATPPTEPEAASPEKPDKPTQGDRATDTQNDTSETLSKGLSKLDIRDRQSSRQNRSSTASPLEEDEEYESPLEPPEELDDDDFSWDSEMDGPVDLSEDDDQRARRSPSRGKNEIFADDPWSALGVLGLRVYSLNSEAKVQVIKSEHSD